jgi:hypothetical protein
MAGSDEDDEDELDASGMINSMINIVIESLHSFFN